MISAASLRLGVVADDVTGACDLAGRVAEVGLPTVVTIGVPSTADGLFPTGDGSASAVIALKIRTAPVDQAVELATRAAERLVEAGATLLYQKYCSTFDSTPTGNIGAVGDALARVAGDGIRAAITVGTPATPAAGRTQLDGVLFVDGVPLAETPMREHPLTPMLDSDVVRLLQPQTPRRVGLIAHPVVTQGGDAISASIRQSADAGVAHLITDAGDEHDLDAIADGILAESAHRPIVATGAAGVATALARAAVGENRAPADRPPAVRDGGRVILSGSASSATRAQNAAFDGPRITVEACALAADAPADVAAELHRLKHELASALADDAPVLVTATTTPDKVSAIQREFGAERAAQLIEDALAQLANHAVGELGVTRLIIAGGETSGAVVAGLGVSRLAVGAQVAPGVPWTTGVATAAGGSTIALLLKSGNFGDDRLFTSAWETAP